MAGFGNQPAGSSPAGWGTPAIADVSGGTILRDTATGKRLGSRKINPTTRDYALDENGRILGEADVRHLVQMAITTLKDSSAVRSLGLSTTGMSRITGDFERRLLGAVTDAVKHLVTGGLITVLGISQYRASVSGGLREGRVYARFRWRDLTTSQEHEELI
jgi:hypothetical protein